MKYFSLNSSSLHILSGDKKLNFLHKILWLIFNFVNNYLRTKKTDKNLKEKTFQLKKKYVQNLNNYKNSSPSRILCNMFFLNYDWDFIKLNFETIKILEIGCGRGVQIELFDKIFNYNYEYLGVDIQMHKEWETLKSNRKKFIVDDYLNIDKYIDNYNIIFSQSVLEHLDNDILLFKKISDNLKHSNKKKMLNLHFFPSVECIFTYRGHGIRQYNSRAVSKLSKNFDKNSTSLMHYLGNKELNLLHKKKFNRSIFKKKNIDTVSFLNEFENILNNNQISSIKNSAFNALEIKTNF